MKRLLLLLLLAMSLGSQAQLYNNEWIDYNKTYYKFKVGVNGIYRISQPAIASLGLGNINADHFQVWRHGKQVPLYTSIQNAPLGSDDFIEFWGEMNDGKPDKELYRLPDYQINDKWSLETDTAFLFLTVNSAGGNLRLINTANNVAANTLAPEPYFMHTAGNYFQNKINPGRAELVGSSYTYSSSYDYGEGWTSQDIAGNSSATFSLLNLRPYTGSGAPAPSLHINAAGNAVNARYFRVKINGDSVLGQAMNYYDYVKTSTNLTVSQISSGTANIEVANKSIVAADRMVLGQIELKYARLFDFGEVNNFTFELPANAAGNYLEIKGINFVAVPPILYDITNGRRYIAEYSNPLLLKYALLPSSTKRTLILTNQHAANVRNITSFTQRNFINYKLAANQADFLIITNGSLAGPSSGIDPIEDYRTYRSSLQGGSFNAKIYLWDQLEDQFGFGTKKHPLSIRNFLRWARANYSAPLKNVFIIGKGVVYSQVRIAYESNPDLDKLDLVPTFGEPASDNLLSAEGSSSIPLTPIGRLSVINRTEIADYLEKVKEYEQVQTVSSPLVSDMLWKKNVVHITGASDDVTTDILLAALNGHKKIIEDTLYGGKVHTFSKSSSSSVEQLASTQLASLINGGVGLLTYFGHSSATTLEFNLDNPQNYNNPGKYPVFIVMGCNAGNFYNFSTTRFSAKETISERYVLEKQRGSVAFMASTHLGIVHYLDIYNTRSYQSASYRKYGGSLGEIMDEAIVRTFALTSENDFYARFQCEQFTLHGDPAIRMYKFDKPDYVIEEPMLKVSPSFISVGSGSFKVTASFANLGKAPNTKMVVSLKHVYPDGSIKITRDTVNGTRYMDSIVYTIPLGVAIRDKGQHKLTVTIDADNNVDEQYETNNSVTKDVYVFEDEIRPVYPYNFSIVNQQDVKFVASTANAFAEMRTYTMEMDTTELFNSPSKVTRTTNSVGGIVEFTPGITFSDSIAYYWRITPTVPNTDPKWNTASFTFINGSSDGFSQGHIYQHFKSDFKQVRLDSTSGRFKFDSGVHNFFMRNGVFPSANSQATGVSVAIDDNPLIISVCGISGIIFSVIDPVTLKPWVNNLVTGPGQYGSDNVCGATRKYNFQYNILDTNKRRKIVQFLDMVPDGYFVVARNISGVDPASNTYASTWKNDESYLGTGNSMYHRLKEQGFADIDSFNRPRAFIFVYKKNSPAFTPKFVFSDGINDNITLSANLLAPGTSGTISSPLFGPARGWKDLHWRGKSIDVGNADKAIVSVYGVNNSGSETLLFNNLSYGQQDLAISSIDPVQFPYVKLRMSVTDTAYYTPYQLKYWMLTYDPVPEGAVAPAVYFTSKDTVEVGEPTSIGIAFKNISKVAFDSLKAKVVITNNKTNVDQTIDFKLKDLQPGDTVKIDVPIDTRSLSGHSTIFMNFNPDFDQPEQYLFNNYVFRNLYVRPDSLNPLLDVTFDGTHILNKDIISPKPAILVKLTDEAKWMVLDDTSLLTVNVRYPDGSLRRFYFNNADTMQFIPAGQAPNPKNEASINFRPYFSQDGEYELIITGKDRSENSAGNIQYRVAFQVYNKAMISNMLNYPNPFTTSTAFVFTITGSEIPQNIRIQILTITGKVVREITKDELGPLHIGRNITEFKWDGSDQYGQKLANGIYLYRVITNLNGKSLDKFKSSDDNTDKFFNNGYGKMYLMR